MKARIGVLRRHNNGKLLRKVAVELAVEDLELEKATRIHMLGTQLCFLFD